MPTRREFFGAAASAAALAMIDPAAGADALLTTKEAELYRQDLPLHELQQKFLDLRFGMFIHFNMATFQDREWGDPTGDPKLFDPTDLNTDQWAQAALSAGMTYGCLTTKHHDGFCIWPTETKSDSVKLTPKKIDVVKAYTDSFRKHGLRVGLYFSILDLRGDIRHFNVTPEKIKRIKDQLTELLTQYGPIDVLIFDGWDAPWSRIGYDEVPFDEIYGLIKKLQPNCLISELNASQYPPTALYYSDIKAFEQNAGQHLPSDSSIPAQSCVTITDGWFWKQSDVNGNLKPVKTIVEEWLTPQNEIHCNLILNAPPDRSGRMAPKVIARLKEIGEAWKHGGPSSAIDQAIVITTHNLATGKPIHASASPDTVGPDEANDGNFSSTWYMDGGVPQGWLEIDLEQSTEFNLLVLVEPVGRYEDYQASRISSYKIEGWTGKSWETLASGGTPSRVQMHALKRKRAEKVRFLFNFSGDQGPHIAELGIYNEPRELNY